MAIEIEIPGPRRDDDACDLCDFMDGDGCCVLVQKDLADCMDYCPGPGHYTLIRSELLTVENLCRIMCSAYTDAPTTEQTCRECLAYPPGETVAKDCTNADIARYLLAAFGVTEGVS